MAVPPRRQHVTGLTCLRRYYRSYLVKALLVSSRSARWALLPAYLAAGAALWGLLQGAQPALWTLGYAACTAAVLVPAKMIEFRCPIGFSCMRHCTARLVMLHASTAPCSHQTS
jgi:DIE2/ALG10 family